MLRKRNLKINSLIFAGLILVGVVSMRVSALGTVNKTPDIPTGAANSLSDGLVGHWTFDGGKLINNVTDSSGQGNDGHMVGTFKSATSSAVTPGPIGQALTFNGSDEYVNMGDVNSAPTQLTLSAWVKRSATGGRYPVIVKGIGAVGNREYALYIESNNRVSGYVADESLGDVDSKTGATNLEDVTGGTPVHVAMTWDGNTLTVYRSGTPDGSVATSVNSGEIEDLSDNLYIGRNETPEYFPGTLDDVRIYNRALSPQEIKRLYDLGSSTHINTTLSSGSLSDGLVGHWTFDGGKLINNVTDSSGQGNDGHMVGTFKSATSSAVTPGRIGQALSFNGDDDVVRLGSIASTDPLALAGSAYTLSAWFKQTSGDTYQRIVDKSSSVNFIDGYGFMTGQSGNGYARGIIVGGDGNLWDTDSSTVFELGVWNHVVASIDASGQPTVLVNGVQYSGAFFAGSSLTPSSDTANMSIGSWNHTTGREFKGTLDDVRIYNRALSPQEIKRLYDLGSSTHINTTLSSGSLSDGLVGHWSFDGGKLINNVTDSSGQGNDGHMVGTFKSATSSAVTPGRIGQALSFNGSDEYVDTGSAQLISSATPFTISWWQRLNAYTNGYPGPLIFKSNEGEGFGVFENTSDSSYRPISFGSPTKWGRFQATNDFSAELVGKWVQFAITYDGVLRTSIASFRLYRDGASEPLETSGAFGGAGNVSNIGKLGTHSLNLYFNGTIDDVRIYNRALSPQEIKRLYDMGH